MNLDRSVLTFLASHRDPVLTSLARLAMTAGTSHLVLLAASILIAGVVAARHWWLEGLAAVGALVASGAAATLLKHIIGRPRPPVSLALVRVGGWSMPSSDAAITSAVAVAVFLAFDWAAPARRRGAACILAVGSAAVGGALVYLGAHWPTDVLTGWLLGAAVGAVSVRLAHGLARRTAPHIDRGTHFCRIQAGFERPARPTTAAYQERESHCE